MSDFFNSSNLPSIIIGITGIVLGLYFYYKRKKIKQPLFQKKTTEILPIETLSIDKLGFTYNNKSVEKLSITKLAFWNEGKESILKSDFIKKAPFIIATHKDIELYDFSIEVLNSNNNIVITEKKNNLFIDFDFLDQFDGFILTVFHNGDDSKNIMPFGSFIGAKEIEEGAPNQKPFDWFMNFLTDKVIGRILSRIDYLLIRIIIGILLIIIFILIFIVSAIPLLFIGMFHDFFINDTPKIYRLEE